MKTPVVREFMRTKLITLRDDMDITAAINLLLKQRISGAPVLNAEGKLVGILSEKDCLRMFANGAYHQGGEAKVSHYMSRELHTIDPGAELFQVADMFLNHSYRRLPVVEDGKLVGQVSRRDVLEGSRKIWEAPPIEKEWTDSKYLNDQIKAALKTPSSKS